MIVDYNVENILHQVDVITKKYNAVLDATGGRFNIFEICGVNHYELQHSRILAAFLDPKGSHGLKQEYLRAFVDILNNIKGKKSIKPEFEIDFNSAIVYLEYTTEQGRIDILIKDNKNNMLIIENKLYANDQMEQLIRYDNYAKQHSSNYRILYLTLNGAEASEQSGKGVDYICISYEKEIIEWLDKCHQISVSYPLVRESILQYINHLKNLTNQSIDKDMSKEIVDILSKPENIEAAKQISQSYSEVFENISKKYFQPSIKEKFDSNYFEFRFSCPEENNINFGIRRKDWPEGLYIWTEKSWSGFWPNTEETRCFINERIGSKDISSFVYSEDSNYTIWKKGKQIELDDWKSFMTTTDSEYLNYCVENIKELLGLIDVNI